MRWTPSDESFLPAAFLSVAVFGCSGEPRIDLPATSQTPVAPQRNPEAPAEGTRAKSGTRASQSQRLKSQSGSTSKSKEALEPPGEASLSQKAQVKAKGRRPASQAPEGRKEASLLAPPCPEVSALLKELEDPKLADAAYRRIWEIPKALIPALISEVENPTPSKVEQLKILVLDPDFVVHGKPFLANRIHGLGQMEVVEEVRKGDLRIVSQAYTKMAYGPAPSQKHYRVVLEKFGGFPVGIVIRAGLINRFKSSRYPSFSDDELGPGKLIDWWREFYIRTRAEL